MGGASDPSNEEKYSWPNTRDKHARPPAKKCLVTGNETRTKALVTGSAKFNILQ